MGRRLALLIGIDQYHKGSEQGSERQRLDINGDHLTVQDLEGCVNDVGLINELLLAHDFYKITSLTSPSLTDDESTLPTFGNIISKLDEILSDAKEGDIFFFHYSGHGAKLETSMPNKPKGRKYDPSLIPMDYCRPERALRGWELNKKLKGFSDKNVHVVVSLDSCYSGGSFRNEFPTGLRIRSPDKGWNPPPPNLASDKKMLPGLLVTGGYRDLEVKESWDINPKHLVVMTACGAGQLAAETLAAETLAAETRDEKPRLHGIFTLRLCQYLQRWSGDRHPTYREIGNHLRSCTPFGQTPRISGRDGLVFLKTEEVFTAMTVKATIQGKEATLPIGKVQGVTKGQKFFCRWKPEVHLMIEEVGDCQSNGSMDQQLANDTLPEFVPYQWYSEKTTEVLVDKPLEGDFSRNLQIALEKRIASDIMVKEGSQTMTDDGIVRFRLHKAAGGRINITGPASLGCQGVARCLDTRGDIGEVEATRAADALAHLIRFKQVHDLRDDTSSDSPPFTITITEDGSPENPLREGREVQYKFKNTESCNLYFTVLNLGPGFQVKQIFPAEDGSEKVKPGTTSSVTINPSLPHQLDRVSDKPGYSYRDIVRTVVTRNKPHSLKSMELPNIWDTATMQCGKWEESVNGGNERGLTAKSKFVWWVDDKNVYTSRQAEVN